MKALSESEIGNGKLDWIFFLLYPFRLNKLCFCFSCFVCKYLWSNGSWSFQDYPNKNKCEQIRSVFIITCWLKRGVESCQIETYGMKIEAFSISRTPVSFLACSNFSEPASISCPWRPHSHWGHLFKVFAKLNYEIHYRETTFLLMLRDVLHKCSLENDEKKHFTMLKFQREPFHRSFVGICFSENLSALAHLWGWKIIFH